MWYTIGLTTCGSSCRSGILQNGGASQLHQTSVVTWQVLRVWPRGRRFIITRESHAGKELLSKAYWYECWFLEGSQVSEYNATWIRHCSLHVMCRYLLPTYENDPILTGFEGEDEEDDQEKKPEQEQGTPGIPTSDIDNKKEASTTSA